MNTINISNTQLVTGKLDEREYMQYDTVVANNTDLRDVSNLKHIKHLYIDNTLVQNPSNWKDFEEVSEYDIELNTFYI
jgi:hypothetical protein